MKKTGSVIAVLILGMMLWLAGCGQASTQEQVTETAPEASLEVWICYDRNVPGAYYVFLWDTLAEQYGYEIEIETYSEQEIRNKLKMALVCNELPDIFYVPGDYDSEYLFEAGACMPVQEYLSGAGFQDKYTIPGEDGNHYIIPCMADSYGVAYYDAALMEEIGLEIPSDWEGLLEMVQKVNAYNQVHGTDYRAIELGMKDSFMGELLYCMLALSMDRETYDLAGTGEASETDLKDMLSETSEAVKQLMELGAFPENYMEVGESEAVSNFINHDAVMMVHQSSLVYHLIQNMRSDGFLISSFPGSAEEDSNGEIRYHLLNMNEPYTPGLAVSASSEYGEEAAELCVEFALSVNRTNVEEHGYLNMTEEEQEGEKSVMPQVQFIHGMEEGAETASTFLFGTVDQETGNEWGNDLKQFFAGETDVAEFSEKSRSFVAK